MGASVYIGSDNSKFKNVTATGVITSGTTQLIGFYVNSTSSGTIVIKDGDASSGAAISGTITPAIGWHFFPATVGKLYVTIANTLNVTLVFQGGEL